MGAGSDFLPKMDGITSLPGYLPVSIEAFSFSDIFMLKIYLFFIEIYID